MFIGIGQLGAGDSTHQPPIAATRPSSLPWAMSWFAPATDTTGIPKTSLGKPSAVADGGADGEADGMMADWVMQVSFRPRLLAIAVERDAQTLRNIRASGTFTVNILSQTASGMALAAKFAQPYFDAKIAGRAATAVHVHPKLDGVRHMRASNGCPVLDDALAWLGCEARELVDAGDHVLVVGEVVDGARLREGDALTSIFTGWSYSG